MIAEGPRPGSNWRHRQTRKVFAVPFGPDQDGEVVAVNDGGCWCGSAESFAEEFEEVAN